MTPDPKPDPVGGRCDDCPRPGHHHGEQCWVFEERPDMKDDPKPAQAGGASEWAAWREGTASGIANSTLDVRRYDLAVRALDAAREQGRREGLQVALATFDGFDAAAAAASVEDAIRALASKEGSP